jgi:hypothetical protein
MGLLEKAAKRSKGTAGKSQGLLALSQKKKLRGAQPLQRFLTMRMSRQDLPR